MADSDSETTASRLLGVTGGAGAPLINVHIINRLKEQYPYECPHLHCTERSLRYRSGDCEKRLLARRTFIEAQQDKEWADRYIIFENLKTLRAEIAKKWGNAFSLEGSCEQTAHFNTGLCTSDECVSCRLEGSTRACAGTRIGNALYREQLQTLKDCHDTRLADEVATQARRAEVLKLHEDLHLDYAQEEIKGLEKQLEMLQLDEMQDTESLGQRFWTLVEHAEQDRMCACVSCLATTKSDRINRAVEEAGVYKQRLCSLLGFDGSGKSTLQRERERIREAVLRDSPFGRTGSYRGFGAGALKPRRHVNPNGGKASLAEPSKTQKKAKKPALVM